MNQRKLWTTVSSVALLGSVLAGCGSNSSNKNDSSNADASTPASTSSSNSSNSDQAKYAKKLTINLGMFDAKDFNDALSKEIEQKFNVDLKLTTINWDTWADQVNVMTASGDMPDVLVFDMKPETYSQYKKLAQQGVIRDIPVLDDKYANLAKLRDEMPVIDNLKIDGKLYAWPKLRGDNPNGLNATQFVVYRQDWAKKLGMDKDEFTTQDIYDLGKAMIEKDPGGNGAGKTVGYADVGWNFGYLMNAFSNTADYEKRDGKYVWTQTDAGKEQGLEFMNKMYKDGVYWKDIFTAKDNDARSLFVSGLLGIYEDNLPVAAYNSLKSDFATANKGVNADDAIKIAKVVGTDGKQFNQEWDNYWSASIFSSQVNDEKMDRILDIMDWSVSPEGQKDFFYGIEGKDWTGNGDQVTVNWPKGDNGLLKAPTYDGTFIRTLAALNGDFQAVNPSVPQQTRDEVLNALKSQTPDTTNLVKLDYSYSYFSGPNKDKYGNFSSDKGEEIKKIVIDSKDVAKDWSAWLDSMKPKVQKVLDELNAQ